MQESNRFEMYNSQIKLPDNRMSRKTGKIYMEKSN